MKKMKIVLPVLCIVSFMKISSQQATDCYDFWVRWTSCPPMSQFPHEKSACFKSLERTFVLFDYKADTAVYIFCDYKAIAVEDLFSCIGIDHVYSSSFDNCIFPKHSVREALGGVNPKEIALSYNPTLQIGGDLSFQGLPETTTIIVTGARNPREINIHFEDIPFLDTISLYETDFSFSKSRLRMLPSLTNFAACKGSLSEIPEGFFNETTGLLHINLGHNCLSDLPSGIFSSLYTIYTIRLNHNCFTFIRSDWFQSLESLLNLDLSYNKLESIPDNLFSIARNIEIFNISSNHHLELNTLQGAESLTELRVDNCSLSSLPPDLLRDDGRLSVFSASQNNLSVLPPLLISAQKSLGDVSLAENHINFIPNGFFSGLGTVYRILLHDNEIKSLENNTFSGLTDLMELDLHSNKLEVLSSLVFRDLKKLRFLDISRNRLRILSEFNPFGNSKFLQLVNVSHNSLIEFPSINWNLHDVLEVDCDHNDIVTANLNPYGRNGTRVTLRNNPIATIKLVYQGRTEERYVTYLIESSSINCDCALQDFLCFVNTKAGRRTFQNANEMRCSKPEIWESVPVTDVYPVHLVCPLKPGCPSDCHCFGMPDGSVLTNCSNARASSPPEEIPPGTSVLYLKNNNITYLPDLSLSWGNVTDLYLTDNSLVSLGNWTMPSTLQMLAIDENKLHELPTSLMERVDADPHFRIYLAGNNWQCDCRSVSFKKWFTRNKDKIVDYNNTLCIRLSREDSNQVTSLIRDVPADLFCPMRLPILPSHITAISVSIVTIAVFLIGFSVAYYRYGNTIMAFLYSHNFYIRCCWEQYADEDKIYDAFICYSSMDRDIVMNMMTELEPSHRLCIHERDWLPGYPISQHIVNSVQNSRKTLILLSKDFLESVWFQVEFRTAYNQMLEDKVHRLVLVIIGELDDVGSLETDLRHLISTNTYLKWGEKWFWEKLRYSLRGNHPASSNELRLECKRNSCNIDGFVQQTNSISVVS